MTKSIIYSALVLSLFSNKAIAQSLEKAGISPWGPDDEIGTLNMMTEDSKLAILTRISSGEVYDLSVDYFVGMPSFHALGDPPYQYWLTHTPHGTVVDNPNGMGKEMNEKVSYTGDAISMYTHMGTHIDALNHFGLNGKIWNGYTPEEYLGDKGWKKTGSETIPPVIARGVLIDIAKYKGYENISDNYRINVKDIEETLSEQGIALQQGDVVLIRTGQSQFYEHADQYLHNYPGINLEAVKWLVEEQKIMLLGADNLSLETFPSEQEDNWVPVHTYLLAEKGVMFIEQMYLEKLAKDEVYEFVFIGASLKLKGASGAPMRPIALPVK